MRKTIGLMAAGVVFTAGSMAAQTVDRVVTFVTGTAVNATGPDPVALGTDGSTWVSWLNGANSQGLSGSSTVVQYDEQGNVMNMYTIAGSVDGLKEDAATKQMWALQNQDGNSTLTLIDLKSGIVAGSPIPYAVLSPTEGYDDVVFENGAVFASYTNPAAPTDPVLQRVTAGTNPIEVNPILLRGATGTNVATGAKNQPLPLNDPDSLKKLPGDAGLQLTSGDDGALIFVENPGAVDQMVSFLNVLDASGNATSGLDDALIITEGRGTFLLSDTGNNQVLKIDVSGIRPGQLFASSGSQNALVVVDGKTGVSTVLYGNLNAPHGMTFVGGH